MDNSIKAVFELGRAAMLAVKDGKIIHMNKRAEALLGSGHVGTSPAGLLPDHILSSPSGNFTTSAIIADRSCCIQVTEYGGLRYIVIEEDRTPIHSSEYLNEGLMASMLSTLFNMGIAIERVCAEAENSGNSKITEYSTILNHNYYNMRHALSNLSTSIALRDGSLPFFFTAVDLARLCSDIVSTVSVICSGRGVSIDFSTRHGELYAYADGEKIERILLNLISNALAHTPKGGKISIGLEKSGDTAYISVDDTGSGIPTQIMAEIFTTYEKKPDFSSPTALSGGLGLSLVKGLAEAHDGALIIESREGEGSSVRIMLPLKSASLSILESPLDSYVNSGMNLILTELAPVLGSEYYSGKYLD